MHVMAQWVDFAWSQSSISLKALHVSFKLPEKISDMYWGSDMRYYIYGRAGTTLKSPEIHLTCSTWHASFLTVPSHMARGVL